MAYINENYLKLPGNYLFAEVARRVAANGVDPLYILHFEYDFDRSDLPKTVKAELDTFRSALA